MLWSVLLHQYLELRRKAVKETVASFARRAQVPQQTIHDVLAGKGCNISTAFLIVKATHAEPACVMRSAPRCSRRGCASITWVLKTAMGSGKGKRKLPKPIAVCEKCDHLWDVWTEVVEGGIVDYEDLVPETRRIPTRPSAASVR